MTISDVLFDLLQHSMPEKCAGYRRIGRSSSLVTGSWWVVMRLDDFRGESRVIIALRYYNTSSRGRTSDSLDKTRRYMK